MRNSDRLYPRPAFLDASRRIRVYFKTSSIAKYAQARFIFGLLGLPLYGSGSDDARRLEDYLGGSQQLVEQKLRDTWLGAQTVYFVEDTYVRVEALSVPTNANSSSIEWARATVPGLRTKEWFESVSFAALDSDLVAKGGDRSVTVYSTIALHVPGVDTPQLFTGSVTGSVASRPGTGLEENLPFPWLSQSSFNAWFVPEGESLPLSDIDLEQSLDVDFRVTALLALADRLEEYVAVLNLPPVSVELVPDKMTSIKQAQLFPTRRPPIVVVGLTCAGKTTLGQFLSTYGYKHVEASSVLRVLQGSDTVPGTRPGYFQAMTTLGLRGWDVIAREAVNLYAQFIDSGICITGLRTVEELSYLVSIFDDLLVVLLEAPSESRFERYVLRNRAGEDLSLTRFRERETEHFSFGLIAVADHCATVRITNNSTLSEFEDIAGLLATSGPTASGPKISRLSVGVSAALKSQIYRCIRVLMDADEAMSPAEIEKQQQANGQAQIVKRNAVRKTLTQYPVLVRRVSEVAGTTFYELTSHGRAYVALIDEIQTTSSYGNPGTSDRSDALSHIQSK